MDMDNGIDESTGPLCLDKTSKEVGDFECHICLQLPEDPIVTLCGHLYCWPCIYRWLHRHSRSHECPVCKAFVEEEKLVPIYGRGRMSLDPKCRSITGGDIPKRPVGQRLEAVPPPAPVGNFFHQEGDGLVVGSVHSGTAGVGNFTFSAAFGGLTPPLNVQLDSNFGGDVESAGEGELLQDQSLADRVTRLEWTLGRFIEETRGRLDRMEGQLNAFEGRFEYLNGYVDRTEEMLRRQQQ